jgi:putative Tad-like protein involved in Flp pilus assembly
MVNGRCPPKGNADRENGTHHVLNKRSQEGAVMDTTYVNTMIVAFLVVVALAVSIGYLYVDEEGMRDVAEMSAMAGTQSIKKRLLAQIQTDPGKLASVTGDTVQAAARATSVEQALGKHKEAALTHAFNNDTNQLTTGNDVTVGFWNISTRTYTPGATPVNAMQVRTRRTAESEATGIGKVGNFLGILSGVQKFDYTPDAVAALPARANASFALCTEACDSRCSYPDVCPISERKMSSAPLTADKGALTGESLASTYLLYRLNTTVNITDLICAGTPSREICKKEILTAFDPQDDALADMESMMYNPNVDAANKEYDKVSGKLLGWWVIAPVTDCLKAGQESRRLVTRYALVRISRICAPGATGCQQNNTSFDSPASVCGSDKGLYIDRISCVSCNSKALLSFPGLNPVLVK